MLRLEDLAGLAHEFASHLQCEVKEFDLGGRQFSFNSAPMVMGVINLSPDSWYRESVCLSAEAAIQRARVLAAQGADLVDIGAESTLAHASRLDDTQQASSLLPVIRQLKSEGILVSAETYSPAVARACLENGASVLNLTGPERCEEIFQMTAEHSAAVIICYVQGANVREVGDYILDGDPIERMRQYFLHMSDIATSKGVTKIILDPGLGFYYRNLQDSALRVRHQMKTFLNTFRLRSLGWPVCHALPHAFEQFGEEVRAAEPFFAVLAALGKTDLFRTHEVPKIRAVLKTLAAY
jgi:dihydropteroate synthase